MYTNQMEAEYLEQRAALMQMSNEELEAATKPQQFTRHGIRRLNTDDFVNSLCQWFDAMTKEDMKSC